MDLPISNKNINELVDELPRLPTYKKSCINPDYSKIPLFGPFTPLKRPPLKRSSLKRPLLNGLLLNGFLLNDRVGIIEN